MTYGRTWTRARARAVDPALGAALLLLVTALVAAAVGAAALEAATPTDPAPTAVLSLSVDDDRLRFVHRGGDSIDVRRLRLRVAADGTPLTFQPPVPFVGARGFRGAPTGPFNAAADPIWSTGETASVTVAGTNHPALATDARVAVTLYVDGAPVARLTATANR